MSLAERILLLAQSINSNISTPIAKKNVYEEDPRPDLNEDHHLWGRLLKLTKTIPSEKESSEVLGVLHGMRCGGTRIVKVNNGAYILSPTVDNFRGWDSKENYESFRDEFLIPHSANIRSLFQKLESECQ